MRSREGDPSLRHNPEHSGSEQDPPKPEKLYGHCFELSRLDEGDQLPIGGESIFTDEPDIHLEVDPGAFSEFIEETHQRAEAYNFPQLREWLDGQGVEIDEHLFAKLHAFTQSYEAVYGDASENREQRSQVVKDGSVKVSDVFANKSVECAEIAALAQLYLQREEVPSTYFSGEVLWKKEHEHAEAHTFLVLRDGEKVWVYDPTNPFRGTNKKKWPAVYGVTGDFDNEMRSGKTRFAAGKDALWGNEAFFGVNNLTSVSAEKDII